MQAPSTEVVYFVIVITTLLLLLFGSIIIRYIFLYQQRRYRHKQEVVELREAFTQTLLESKLAIREQTLDHVGKELHANISHLASLININLAALQQEAPGAHERVTETKALAKQLMGELKALSTGLNTDFLVKIGFSQAVDNELKRLEKARKYGIRFSKTGDEYRLKPEHEIILFRLCQELLNNILRYAQATNVTVALTYAPDRFCVKIQDDGIGFDPAAVLQPGTPGESTGLLNIQGRSKLINATTTIHSEQGKGTSCTIIIPINP